MSMTFEQGKAEIAKLVKYFSTNEAAFHDPGIREADVCASLIEPFFVALGWDVRNTQMVAPQYREVIPQEKLDDEGHSKSPDYAFRARQTPKFYSEAKKPSVNIKDDPAPAYQLRRYAWSAKLPLSILTNFEEFAVFEGRTKPVHSDKANKARIWYFTFDEYEDRWRDIWDLFSHEAVLGGRFDQFVESKKGKRPTATVDAEFLKEIEGWREALARNMAIRNPKLSDEDLNKAVQLTIDRIIFLRMAEDRGIEQEERLLKLTERPEVYRRFIKDICRTADDKYNSGLFHFDKEPGVESEPDKLTPGLVVDDKVLKPILTDLYFPSPYAFQVLPVEILGNIYEQFLGKVIRLTKGHQAKVEEKPEVRKAGGVYYTPAYIVDYIVKNTAGVMVEGKSPAQLAGKGKGQPLRILDMACGSGSFLLGAYQCLLNYCLKWYTQNGPQKYGRAVWQGNGQGAWRLTIGERKRILTTHIFGVDIDPQAVEVTKLSLLLKVLEGETDESLGKQTQRKLFDDRALPNLDQNIKCGNSIISADYRGELRLFSDHKKIKDINPLDWKTAFPIAMRAGGFDCVIGNPPWGADFETGEKSYLDTHYDLNSGKYESYIFFIERAINLVAETGYFGFIVPTYWVSRSQTEPLRKTLSERLAPSAFAIMPENVFQGVKMDSCIIVARKAGADPAGTVRIGEITQENWKAGFSAERIEDYLHPVRLDHWRSYPAARFNPRIEETDFALMEKLASNTVPLGSLVEITQGLTLYRRSTLVKRFGKAKAEEIVAKRLFHSDRRKNATFKKELLGQDVARYSATWNGTSWVSYGPWLAHAVDERFFHGPRLVIQKIRNPSLKQRLVAGYLDDDDTYSAGVVLNAIPVNTDYSLFYCLGLLNSTLINYGYRKTFIDVSIRVVDLKEVRIHRIDFSEKPEKAKHDRMVGLVEQMLRLHKLLGEADSEQSCDVLQHQIDATDAEIDRLVYDLYGLTKDEIRIVEQAALKG